MGIERGSAAAISKATPWWESKFAAVCLAILFLSLVTIALVAKAVNPKIFERNDVPGPGATVGLSSVDWKIKEWGDVGAMYMSAYINNPLAPPVTNLRIECDLLSKKGIVLDTLSTVFEGTFAANDSTWVEGYSIGDTRMFPSDAVCRINGFDKGTGY